MVSDEIARILAYDTITAGGDAASEVVLALLLSPSGILYVNTVLFLYTNPPDYRVSRVLEKQTVDIEIEAELVHNQLIIFISAYLGLDIEGKVNYLHSLLNE